MHAIQRFTSGSVRTTRTLWSSRFRGVVAFLMIVSGLCMLSQHATAASFKINAGGAATSGWSADGKFSGGSTGKSTAAVSTAGVTNPAPQAVYQTERWGNFTYTFSGLPANTDHKIRLHFNEFYYAAIGQRIFSVQANGANILTDFDIIRESGSKNKAIAKDFTIKSNASGVITLNFTNAKADDPKVSGIELLTITTPPPVSNVPTSLTASNVTTTSVSLSWGAPTNPSGIVQGYNIYNGSAKLTPSPVASPTYTVTGLTPATSYTFTVKAVVAGVESAPSSGITVTTLALAPAAAIRVNAGGSASSNWTADAYYSGGTASASTVAVQTSNVTSPAPQAVYQTERWGSFTYTFSGLQASTDYQLRLHFNEFYWTAPGQRVFTVQANGVNILSNFDIIAAAGSANVAIIRDFTVRSNTSGSIVLNFTNPTADEPKISGIELALPLPSNPDNTPAGLTASNTSASGTTLTWQAPANPTGTITGYTIYQNNVPLNTTPVLANSYPVTGLTASTTYTFTVKSTVAGAESNPSNTLSVTTLPSLPATATAFPLRVSSNKRYLEDQTGNPYYMVADTSWSLMTKLSLPNIKQYIDLRAAQGFNTIMTSVSAFDPTSTGPRGSAFVGGNVTNWNQSYFDGMKEAVQYAQSKNVQILINPLWMSGAGGGTSGGTMPSPADMSTYGTRLANFFHDTPNIAYFLGGDIQADVVWNPLKALADAMEAADPTHIKTYHPQWYSYTATANEAWLDFNSYQYNDNTGSMLYDLTASGYGLTPTRPIFCIEPPYDPQTAMNAVQTTPLINRQNNWGSALAGALGISYGGPRSIWFIGENGDTLPIADINRPAASQTVVIGKIMSSLNWQLLAPNNNIVTSGLGSGRDRATSELASDGSLMVVYVPSARSITLDLKKLSGSATAQWYNPTDGQKVGSALTVQNTGSLSFTNPNAEDGVLVIAR